MKIAQDIQNFFSLRFLDPNVLKSAIMADCPDRLTRAAWSRISAIFAEILETPPADRSNRLKDLCGSDEEARREVESLLEAHDAAGDFGERPSAIVSECAEFIVNTRSYERLGPYQLLGVIGQGGMGTVYRARRADDEFHREVAIKVVSRGMNTDFVLRRFRSERQILADLAHPNITTLLDGGSTPDGLPYIVMEFIVGEAITTHCDSHHLDLRARVLLFQKVCLALAYAHEHHVIHRDLKPSNILVTKEGVPKLLDFGIARILNPNGEAEHLTTTLATRHLLTPQYASPEQFVGHEPSEASDIYSLGVILWELVTGKRPYHLPSGSFLDSLPKVWESDPEPPATGAARTGKPWARSIDRELEAVMRKALRKDPRARYPSAAELADDLSRWLEHTPVRALRGAGIYRLRRILSRWWYWAAAAVFAIAIGITVWSDIWQTPTSPSITVVTKLPGLEVYPNLSPDGSRVVFSWNVTPEGQFDIYTQPAAGGNPARLTSDPHDEINPVWSPNGSRIAFLRREDARGLATVRLLTLANGQEISLGEVAVDDQEPFEMGNGGYLAWHPIEPWLVTSNSGMDKRASSDGLWLIHTATGEKRRLTTGRDVAPAFSPSGRELVFVRRGAFYSGEVYLLKLNRDLKPAADPVQITVQSEQVESPVWHPDGSWLFYLRSGFEGDAALMKVRPSQPAAAIQVDKFTQPTFHLSNAIRDAKGSVRLAAVSGNDDFNVWMVRDPLDREPAPAPLFINSTRQETVPQFSPDGSQIAVQSNRSGAAEIWIFRADGTAPRQLSSFGGAFIGLPEWSPDGKHILTHARTAHGIQLFDLPVDGGPGRQLTADPQGFMVPSVSRDGKWIYAVRSGVWRIPRWGGAATKIVNDSASMPVESCDRKLIYYSRNEAGKYSLWQIPSQGGEERKVLDGLADQSAFRPVEDGIYIVAAGERAVVQFYDFGTGRRRDVARLSKPYGWGLSVFPLTAGIPRTLLINLLDIMEADLIQIGNLR